ncbi:MAG: hypothetical protein JW843_00810 [Candidatus Aminicenantes bacterium]|nr:hypothetical protein [Candidatus Aminicenantes bacterium]
MKIPFAGMTAAFAAGAVLIAFLGLPAAAQTKPTQETYKLEELTGDYEFTAEGDTLYVRFFVDNGKLWGAPPDETPEELNPVKDKPLCFDVMVQGTEYYFLKFIRNDQGEIDTCIMSVQGMEITGKKIKK